MRFVDLFAGLGGFHLALAQLGHECVFASEIDEGLRTLYQKNFGLVPAGDLREVDVSTIPVHDVLCAGFPCQPFSKAGRQDGLRDPKLGQLYREIHKVIAERHPRYFILENVPNFQKHDKGKTWEYIKCILEEEGYDVRIGKLSPHRFGIPQIRERVYIVGSTDNLNLFEWPRPRGSRNMLTVEDYLDSSPLGARKIPDQVKRCLAVWQEFLDKVPRDEKIPHPLWSMEFGADYPYQETTPSNVMMSELRGNRGSFGQPLSDANNRTDMMSLLPSHARRNQQKFPDWKVQFIRRNREFYDRHKTWLDGWLPEIQQFPSSLQKLEWNCQEKDPREEVRQIRKYVIQIRASGVRVKRKTTAPSLVAMTATQVPIIGWKAGT